jgi:hypothetical protein
MDISQSPANTGIGRLPDVHKVGEKMDTTTVGMSIFSRKFRG